jgi:hypothetical protein
MYNYLLAQAAKWQLPNPLGGGSGIANINDFLGKVLEGIVKIGIPVAAIAIIYAGFKFVAAQGNPEKLKKARQTFCGHWLVLLYWQELYLYPM